MTKLADREYQAGYRRGLDAACAALCRYCFEAHPVRRNRKGRLVHVRPSGCDQPCAARKVREALYNSTED